MNIKTKDFKMDVVYPHLNYKNIKKSLHTLRERTPKENLGKVILINQSGETREDLDKFVDIHVKIKNQGFARACNLGIRLSDSPFVACMNDDVEIVHSKWIEGIVETFNRYDNALCVSPSSPRNPAYSGGPGANHPGFDHKEEWTEEDYDRMVAEIGKGHIYDGICMYAPIFNREKLDKLPGIIPGKAWFDELFFPGGGDDYCMNRRAYLSGMRCLGSGLSYVWHWWGETANPDTGKTGVKFSSDFNKKYGIWKDGELIEAADIYGKNGNKNIPQNIIRE